MDSGRFDGIVTWRSGQARHHRQRRHHHRQVVIPDHWDAGAVVFGPGSGRKHIAETKQTPSIAAEGHLTAGRLRRINMSRGARSGWLGPSQGPASANPEALGMALIRQDPLGR